MASQSEYIQLAFAAGKDFPMRGWLIGLFWGALIARCGGAPKVLPESPGVRVLTSQFSGLFFTAADLQYTSSSLYWMDFQQGTVKETLSGESGDPWVLPTPTGVLMVNRTAQSHNAFFVERKGGTVTPQKAIYPQNVQSAVYLENQDLLLSDGVSATWKQLHGKTLELRHTHLIPLALGGGAVGQASDLLRVRIKGVSHVMGLVHGIDNGWQPNGAQTLVIFEEGPASQLVKKQVISLPMTSPHFLRPDETGVWILGLCTKWMLPRNCKAGAGRYDFHTATWGSEAVVPDGVMSEGEIVGGEDPREAFAFVSAIPEGKRLIRLRIETEGRVEPMEEIHRSTSSIGSDLLLLDSTSHTLYVGDWANNQGQLLLWNTTSHRMVGRVKVEKRPYNGALVR